MRFYAETLGLPRGAEILLRDLIHERIGLFYENERLDWMMEKLSPLVVERGFNSFLDYYYLLKYDATAAEEWGRIVDTLSVQETYFWREIDQVQTLVKILMPELAARAMGEPVRIWSVPCATGEEPLTLAMALQETGWFDRVKIEIWGSDASPGAIDKARRGVYRERSFRQLPPELRAKYFVQEDAGWRVAPELHTRIKWTITNLADRSETAPMIGAPIVFCRNVFIYFSEQMIRQTVRMFAEQMPKHGYLCVGASESLIKHTTDFELREIGGAFIYVKR
jgi:chemotaxis protein methyltransferase CheR